MTARRAAGATVAAAAAWWTGRALLWITRQELTHRANTRKEAT